MKTYCNTGPNTPPNIRAQLDKIESALGDCVVSDANPCGGCAYYDEGEENPWRVLFIDGADESFANPEEAAQAAKEYADEYRATY